MGYPADYSDRPCHGLTAGIPAGRLAVFMSGQAFAHTLSSLGIAAWGVVSMAAAIIYISIIGIPGISSPEKRWMMRA